MDVGGVSPSVLLAAQLANPAVTSAAVTAVVAARPDLARSPAELAGQVAQQLVGQQALQHANQPAGYTASGNLQSIGGTGVLDVYA